MPRRDLPQNPLRRKGRVLYEDSSDSEIFLPEVSECELLDEVQYLFIRGEDLEKSDDHGYTPLHNASYNGHLDVVSFLVSKGAALDRGDNDGCTPLHKASYNGHLDVVQFLLSKGANFEQGDNDGYTPLHHASYNGHLDVVQFFGSKGADLDKSDNGGYTPVHNASYNGHLDVVQYLVNAGADLDKGDKKGLAPLHHAALNGHDEVVQFLISKGADLEKLDNNGRSSLHYASYNGHIDVVQYLVSQGAVLERADVEGRTPLHDASSNGHFQVLQYLVSRGAFIDKVDDDGWTPLNYASTNGNFDIVEYVVSKKADPEKGDNDGYTPLHSASYNGHLKVVKFLIDLGVQIEKCDTDGSTPLQKASYNGHLDVVKCLVTKGAALDKGDNDGCTPLHKASYSGHLGVVKYLLDKGAELENGDKDGKTPLYYASHRGHLDVVQYLISTGARFEQDEQTLQPATLPEIGTKVVADLADTDHAPNPRDGVVHPTISAEDVLEQGSVEQPQSTESRVEFDMIRLEKYHMEVRIPPGEAYSSNDITVQAITEVPPDLVLNENEVLISIGLKLLPSDIQFGHPVKVTVNHSAIFSDPWKAQIVLYTRKNSTESFSALSPTMTGIPRCVVRQRDLDLYIDHFSEWWIAAYIRWAFIGKRVLCTPYIPTFITRNAKYVLYLCITDDNSGNPKDIPGYKMAFPKTQFYVKWRYGDLIITFYKDNLAMITKRISEEKFYYLTDQTASFDLDIEGTTGEGVFIKYALKQSIEEDIYFKIDIENLQERCRVTRVPEESQPVTIGRIDSQETRLDQVPSHADTPSTSGVASRKYPVDEDDVSDVQILKLSKHLRPDQFYDLHVALGIDYSIAQGITKRTTDTSEQYIHLLHTWKSESPSIKVRDLKKALDKAKAGGLVNQLYKGVH